MPNEYWKDMNRMPIPIRKKTTDANRKIYEALVPVAQAKGIHRSKRQVHNILEEEECLLKFITAGHFYSTLDGAGLYDFSRARVVYKTSLLHGDFDFANMYTTVWVRDDWRMLKDVYTEL